jgi:MFS family permease
MLPVLTRHVYHRDSDAFGLLYSATAVGALTAAGMLAVRQSVVGLGRWILYASLTFNLGLLALGLAPNIGLGLVALAIIGFGLMKTMGSTNTLIQTLVEDRMRGRVMSFYMMSFVGTMPIGSFLGGFIAEHAGPQWTLVCAAGAGLIGSIIYYIRYPALRTMLRPIYEEKGILQPAGQ